MLAALEERGFATHEKYEGVSLTDDGEETARKMLWRYCVAENFLEDDLGLDAAALDDGDGDPRAIGHTLSEETVHRLREYVGHPCDGACSAPQEEYGACSDDVREKTGE